MLLWNTVEFTHEFTHMPLGLIPKILDTVDMVFMVCKKFRMVDAEMFKIRHVQHIIASPTVRIDNAVRNDLAFNNGIQCC